MATLAVDVLDGLAYGMLLFCVGAGLALIFGVMDVLNLAHGSLYLAGAYLAATLTGAGVLGWVAAVLAGVAVGGAGGALLAGLLRPLAGGGHLEQALLTLGVAFVAAWAFTAAFGAAPRAADPPPPLAGSLTLGGHGYPVYRLVFLAVAGLLGAGLYLLVRRSRAGLLLRATTHDPAMAAASGIRVTRVRVVAFAAGGSLATVGGVLGAPLIGPAPGVDTQILVLSLIVVVLGGAGSLPRTAAAALLVGLVQTLTGSIPALAPFLLFTAVLLVLVSQGRALSQGRAR